jgi:hypothetical protein
MTFEEYLNDAWASHQGQPAELLKNFRSHFSLINSSDEVTSMGHLIAHVSGEHLGEWGKGVQLLEELRENPHVKDKEGLNRFIAALSLGEDEKFSLNSFSDSDKVRILAMTASALATQNNLARAAKYFTEAEEICKQKLDKKDPANKNLAIAGNNLACALEEKETLSQEETNLMIHAAFTARKFWEIAGTWLEIERAEYRLAKIFLKADILDKAYAHAEKCLEIISDNGSEPLEEFFGLEVIALIEKAKGNELGKKEAHQGMCETFNKINPEDQTWCKETLEKVAGA